MMQKPTYEELLLIIQDLTDKLKQAEALTGTSRSYSPLSLLTTVRDVEC